MAREGYVLENSMESVPVSSGQMDLFYFDARCNNASVDGASKVITYAYL